MSRSSLINSSIGEYRLVEKLGEGGMGEVYQGVHSKIGRVVAVKILSQGAHGPQFVERFLNEARIQGGLQHHNIATLYDFLEYNGQPCIIMEYIEGRTLTDCVRAWGGLPLLDAIRYFQSIVEAIDYVHSRGIVHRDIKSNNVKITPSGQVKLLDFGIAKSGASPALTVTGAFVGTLQYLSPEQLVGGIADVRSDIWSLGVLLYEMTTSHLPFDANTIGELCQKISKASYTPPSVMNQNVPREVQNIVSRCLKKNPADRYQSARELLQDVNYAASALSLPPTRLASPAPVTAPSYSEPTVPVQRQGKGAETLAAKPKSSVPIIAAIAGVALLVVLVGLYFLWSGDPDSAAASKPPQQSGVQPPPAQKSSAAPPRQEIFTVDVAEGRAEVYRDGQLVGTTPYQFQSKSGEQQVELVLKREGYVDKPVRLSTTETKKTYTYMLEKKY
ncbi:MAG TPA: serine/threonine-protein kinase [Blastocatellia bacterium]|nr:serine/threonine-protein kinase [Blastocatellia bacterium]